MDTIPNIEVQKLPDGHDCGDCIYFIGCIKMDTINCTTFCTCVSQTECPKRNFILRSDWEEIRARRREENMKHQRLLARQRKNKKKRRKR